MMFSQLKRITIGIFIVGLMNNPTECLDLFISYGREVLSIITGIDDCVLLMEFAKAVQIFIRNVSDEQLSVALDVVQSIREILSSSDERVIRIMRYNNVTFLVDEGFNERKSNP